MTESKLVSIVVPFLNEEANLPLLYDRLVAALGHGPERLEMLFVDDGSSDGSVPWLKARAAEDPRVKLLRLSRNFGHQLAITAGLDYAGGDAVIIMDADLQDPPEVTPELLAQWRNGFEIVYAVRRSREGETWIKKMLAAGFYRIFHRITKVNMPMNAGDFRLLDRRVVRAMRQVRETHRFMRGLTCWTGFAQTAVHYDRAARHSGVTKYPTWKSAQLAWDAITSFSGTPLRWVTGLGILIALLGVAKAVEIVVQKIVNPDGFVAGWTTTVCFVLVIGGLQLLCLGLIGQYVSRVFEETKKRPLYFVRETVGELNGPPDTGW